MGLNDIVKYISITIAIALICSTSSALTTQAKLITYPKGTYTYNSIQDYKEEVVFEQVGADVTFVKQPFNTENCTTGKKIQANQVPGKNANGFSKLIVTKIDDKTVSIDVQRREYPNKNSQVDLSYKVNAVFAEGSWSDFISDKNVLLVLTPKARQESESKLRAYMAQIIKALGDKMNPIGDFNGIELKPENFKFNMTSIQGTKRKLLQTFDITTKFKLY